jgi:hypothetical protein
MSNYSGPIVNVATGQCLSAPNNDGETMIVADCVNGDSKQTINVSNADKVKASDDQAHRLSTSFTKGNQGIIDTWNGSPALYWSGQCGKGNDCDFHVWSVGGETGHMENGPFKLWGWNRHGGHDAAAHTNNQVRQDQPYDGQDRAKWLTGKSAETCKTYGVPLSQCTSNQITLAANAPECFQHEQWKRGAEGCPLAYGCKQAGVPLTAEACTEPKLTLAKQCQAVGLTSCTTEQLNARREKCYNLGLCIDNGCSAAGSFGGCTPAKIEQIEAECKAAGLTGCSAGMLQAKIVAGAATEAAEQQTADNKATLDSFTAALNASLNTETETPVEEGSNAGLYIAIGGGVGLIIIFIIVVLLVRR